MKTIGLVTYYNSDNYGALLQAYALQREIVRDGCECTVISHNRFSVKIRENAGRKSGRLAKFGRLAKNVVRYPRSVKLRVSGLTKAVKHGKTRQQLANAAFRNAEFPATTEEFYVSTKQIMNNPPLFDGYVCGSDQIWNPERFEGAEPFFLAFAPEGRSRIAYAPSLAMTEIPAEMAERYRELVTAFSNVSVREKKGCEAVERATGVKPVHVMDPTFLMSREDWKEFGRCPADVTEPYIFCYFLSKENLLRSRKTINTLAKQLGAGVVVLPYGNHKADGSWSSFEEAGPREFVGLIDRAAYVLTDSFHGTSLSILLGKQFNVYAGTDSAAFANRFDRIRNVLEVCGLEGRRFTGRKDLDTTPIDFNAVGERLEPMVRQSKEFLQDALDKVRENGPVARGRESIPRLASYEACTGCAACSAVCPKKAIRMVSDKAGFRRPTVDEELCVRCGRCESACPILNSPSEECADAEYYAIYAKDPAMRARGSSGNAFGLLAQSVLAGGGEVFGAELSDDCRQLRMKGSDEVGLERLQKSKYFEAEMGDVHARIREALESGREVMFTGTPCQAAGVRKVFGDNPKLLICEFLCHGVVSDEWFGRYLTEMESRYGAKAEEVSFRSKALGWKMYCMKIRFANGKEYLKTRFSDPYYIDFFANRHLRTNCYNCDRLRRSAADITVGDYWAAAKRNNMEDTDEGISVVRLRTKRGRDCFRVVLEGGETAVRPLTAADVDETFVSRTRKVPAGCDELPEHFPMKPRLSLKARIYRIYAEYIQKPRLKRKHR